MFFSRKSTPELTSEGYTRWLRAQRPPFIWFLELSELEQEALANAGEAHASDLIEGLAIAVGNPDALAVGLDVQAAAKGDADAEETLARQLAAGMAARLSQGAQKPAAVDPNRGGYERSLKADMPTTMPRETFAGFGERHVEEHDEGEERRKPTLFGRRPDEVAQ